MSSPAPDENERFQPQSLAGSGGMGEVWVASDHEVGRPVALKVIRADLAEDEAAVAAFIDEARLTARLDHPGVVPVHALTTTADGRPAYAMKLVVGRTLSAWLADARSTSGAAYSLQRRLELFLKLCDALAYAHDQGVIHSDLKPANLMVGDHGELFVMDWGVAQRTVPAATALAVGGATVPFRGTPQYMSPEQARTEPDLDARSDQYALGLLLFEMVALKPAVSGADAIFVLARQAAGRRDPFVHVAGERVAPELQAVVAQACALDRARRYPDVAALAEDVRRFLRGEAVAAQPDTRWQASRRWVGRHRELTIALVVVLLGLLLTSLLLGQMAVLRVEQRAELHRERLGALQVEVAARAADFDTRFATLEGLLGVVAAAAVDRLGDAFAPEGPVFWADGDTALPGALDSLRHGKRVSFLHASFLAPPGVNRPDVEAQAARLATLRRLLRRTLLASASDDAVSVSAESARSLLSVTGTPIVWASIGLTNGLYLTFPGHSDLPARYDPRTRPWYKSAIGHRDPQWGSPYNDADGLGVLLPCSVSLIGEDDAFLGVASIRIPFTQVLAGLGLEGGLPGAATVTLLDEHGRVVVASHRAAPLVVPDELASGEGLMRYPVAAVVDAVRSGKSGVAREGPDLVLYARMPALGWTYVVRGPEHRLLANE